ncbi:piggyBac transposable element-derived protein 4-like [Haliotis asinina]|uniref:piggyBac transposable element-derived protein 4-like n=1 Tax=Haliotis asinina TaxID=109174 RepID=UPI003531EA3E
MASAIEDFRELFGNSDSEGEEDFFGFEDIDLEEVENLDLGDDEEDFLEDPSVGVSETPWLQDFVDRSGPRNTGENLSEYDAFSLFFNDEVFDLLVTETNRYAAQFIAEKMDTLKVHSRAKNWKAVDTSEMRAFISILLVMGLSKKPSYESYWSSDPLLECKGFKAIMARDRFIQILMFFHLNDNAKDFPKEDPRHDKLFKIRPLMKILVPEWQRHFHPGREVSVDESMIPFKGRTGLLQYMPNKPHKWGIKSWGLADSRTGYMWNWQIYTGRQEGGRPHGLTYEVVTSLCQPLYGKGHHVYMDNFFTSPSLFQELSDNQTGACGTLRASRLDVPQPVKDARPKAGDDPHLYRDNEFLYITWTDKRKVNLLTSIHNGSCFLKRVRSRASPNNFRDVRKPKAVQLYSQHMGGVDQADKQLQYYMVLHRCCKWWKKVFLYLMEVSFSNALIIFKAANPGKRVSSEKFRLVIATRCLEGYERQGRARSGRPATNLERPARLTARHFPGKTQDKTPKGKISCNDCVVCSFRGAKRHQTTFICKNCNVHMCPVPCFERYHTLINYKVQCYPGLHD